MREEPLTFGGLEEHAGFNEQSCQLTAPLKHTTTKHTHRPTQQQLSSKMDAMLKNVDKDTLKKGADTVVDKAAEQLGVDASKTGKAKEATHKAIDKMDVEQLKAAAPQAAEAAKNLLGK